MKGIVIINKNFVPIGYNGIALFPFIFIKNERLATKERLNHEQIHIRQQIEMLVVFFYLAYGLNFAYNYIKGVNKPYRNILFEQEAYTNQSNLRYLKTRSFWAWIKY